MVIDTKKIWKALNSGTAQAAADNLGLSLQTIKSYRSREGSSAFRDWRGMNLETAERIMRVINKEEKEMEKQLKFEEDVEKYGKSVSFDEAVSDIFANLPESLEIGDTQNYLLSDANKFHSSASFEFEVVGFDEDELPVFEYTGFNSIV
ncbi:hypothetical protein [Enterococcus diestrammenae]|uniref:Uncharacterized protein n=1 Tax=Enterococcus diestrammenae TaxID=1155073 RepID=A0ABV0F516_9ENTE|nr:hypothetical protein [Enterococcus diestrammenae]KAF1299968.1 hypothetical protein BAU18_11740 [Enterococcus diestrammenae]